MLDFLVLLSLVWPGRGSVMHLLSSRSPLRFFGTGVCFGFQILVLSMAFLYFAFLMIFFFMNA